MPLINVKVIEDVFTSEQKEQIIERLTDAMVSIEGENMRGVTWVVVEEVNSGDWGIGGQPFDHRRCPGSRRGSARLTCAATRADQGSSFRQRTSAGALSRRRCAGRSSRMPVPSRRPSRPSATSRGASARSLGVVVVHSARAGVVGSGCFRPRRLRQGPPRLRQRSR